MIVLMTISILFHRLYHLLRADPPALVGRGKGVEWAESRGGGGRTKTEVEGAGGEMSVSLT